MKWAEMHGRRSSKYAQGERYGVNAENRVPSISHNDHYVYIIWDSVGF
jgi:hypothetical protein